MIGPIFPIEGRAQSRAFASQSGAVYGVAASKAFGAPSPGGDITDHAKGAFGRMDEILTEAGLTRADICSVTVFLHDVDRDVEGFNAIWREVFDGLFPARCCIGARLQAGMLVELTFVAERQNQAT